MIKICIDINGEEKRWEVQNPNVERILEKIPPNKLPEYLEMYILIGDTVINYASIQTSEETLQKYFGEIIQKLTKSVEDIMELKEKVDKEISENLPEIIKEKIESEIKEKLIELKAQIDALNDIKENLPDTIKAQLGEYVGKLDEAINNVKMSADAISKVAEIYRGSSTKGKLGEIYVYNVLVDNFNDDFEDVSKKKNYTDIKASSSDIVDILIEVKNYSNPVDKKEVEKFWADLDKRNIKVGCFISLGTKIQGGIGNYKIETKNGNVGIFMNVSQFLGERGMEDGIKLAYFIARKFAEYFKKIEMERVKESELKQKIDKIYEELNILRSKIEKLKEIEDKIKSIEENAKNSIAMINDLYRETTSRIDNILIVEGH